MEFDLTKFRGRHLCQDLFFNRVTGKFLIKLFKKRLWYRCFPVNFVELLRTPFLTEDLCWLLLSEANYLLLYKLIYARLLKIYTKPVSQCGRKSQNHNIRGNEPKMELACSSDAVGLSSN